MFEIGDRVQVVSTHIQCGADIEIGDRGYVEDLNGWGGDCPGYTLVQFDSGDTFSIPDELLKKEFMFSIGETVGIKAGFNMAVEYSDNARGVIIATPNEFKPHYKIKTSNYVDKHETGAQIFWIEPNHLYALSPDTSAFDLTRAALEMLTHDQLVELAIKRLNS